MISSRCRIRQSGMTNLDIINGRGLEERLASD
jgi:hypothetical protein